ncbi:MAG: Leucine-rich repeat (LRR) protein [Verrucomicrobiales bacterium]|jgi:Leucine-rich repeat (LRR) protein
MIHRFTIHIATCVAFASQLLANPGALEGIRSQADLDAVIAATSDSVLQQALKDHSADVLAAAARHSHVLAVIKAIETSPGSFEKTNTTPDELKMAAGGEIPLFDSLTLVDLRIPNKGPHAHRDVNPYDAAFFEHLGHIDTLETLDIIATKLNDAWIAPLGKLANLKLLKITNNGKLTDAGMEHLAGLTNLEKFNFVGTGMTGRAYAKFEGWTNLKTCSHRGSSIDDEGLRLICEHLPNLESLSLAHARFTDVGAVHLAKLTKLKRLEIGSRNATPQCLVHLRKLSLEYLQIGDGLDTPEGIALIKDMPTLRQLTLTGAKALTDDELKMVAGSKQLEHIELGGIMLPDERIPLMSHFAFLKSIRLVPGNGPFSEDAQVKI